MVGDTRSQAASMIEGNCTFAVKPRERAQFFLAERGSRSTASLSGPVPGPPLQENDSISAILMVKESCRASTEGQAYLWPPDCPPEAWKSHPTPDVTPMAPIHGKQTSHQCPGQKQILESHQPGMKNHCPDEHSSEPGRWTGMVRGCQELPYTVLGECREQGDRSGGRWPWAAALPDHFIATRPAAPGLPSSSAQRSCQRTLLAPQASRTERPFAPRA